MHYGIDHIRSELIRFGFEKQEGSENVFFKKNVVDDAITYSVTVGPIDIHVEVYQQADVDEFRTILTADLDTFYIEIKPQLSKRKVGVIDSVTLHDTRTGVAVTLE